MARVKQYGDPISIPFSFGVKERVENISEKFDVSQAEIIRRAVEGSGLDVLVEELIEERRYAAEQNEIRAKQLAAT